MNNISENNFAVSIFDINDISFNVIADHSSDLIEVLDLHGKRLYLNAACFSVFGGLEDILGTCPGDDSSLTNPEKMQSMLVDVISTGRGRCEEFHRIMPDGATRYFETRANSIRDEDNRINYILLTSKDITDREQPRQLFRNYKTRLKVAQDIGTMGAWEYDYGTDNFLISENFAEIFGLPSGTYRLKIAEIMALIHPKDRIRMSVLKSEKSVGESIYETQYKIVRADTSERVIQSRWQVVHDDMNERSRSIGVCQDVTDRITMERTDLTIEDQFQYLAEITRDFAIFLLDMDGKISSWNRGAERIKGYRAEEVLGRHYSCFCLSGLADSNMWLRQLEIAVREGRFETEDWRVRKDGDQFWAHIIISPFLNISGKQVGYLMIVHDMTKQKCTEDILRSQAERLKVNARRLVELQETERQHLARELHDLVGPNLTALGINLQLITSRLSQGSKDDVSEVLRGSIENVHSMVDTLRYIIGELRPHTLDDFGLRAGLRSHVAQFMKLTGIRVHIDETNSPESLPDFIKLSLFRITQEALNNIAKHSRATRVEISIVYEHDKVGLCIEDNGIGFDMDRVVTDNPSQGVGLLIIRERAEAIGASFDLQTAVGQGVRLVLVCNLQERGN